jgi:hypothetical protein
MKPAAQSKFRRYFIKIGAGFGFWKAALQITPYLPPQPGRFSKDRPGADGTLQPSH